MSHSRPKPKNKKTLLRTERPLGGIELTVLYEGPLDRGRDRPILAVLEGYCTGSGFSLATGKRDIGAVVPADEMPRVLGALKKISGIQVRQTATA